MTDLEQQLTDHLRRRAAAAIPRYDLEGIERGDRLVSLDDVGDLRRRRPMRRTTVGVAAAVTLLVALTGVVITRDRDEASVIHSDRGWPQAAHTELFTDLAPGEEVPLPPAPMGMVWPAAAWTGSELILCCGDHGGAAFDAARGMWRTIAPAPVDFTGRSAFWTGTEMIVCCDLLGDAHGGIAYDPASDAWRRLPDAPIGMHSGEPGAVWTGEEVIVLGGDPTGTVTVEAGLYVTPVTAAAYDPAADRWRRLADLPVSFPPSPVWTGTSILAVADLEAGEDGSRSGNTVLLRYDLDTDTWTTIREVSYVALVGRTGAEGGAGPVLGVPAATGAPLDVLDSEGRVVGTLPAPVEAERFGGRIDRADGTWVGRAAVLVLSREDGTRQFWALDPVSERWRQLAVRGHPWAVAGDVLFTWPGETVEPDGFVAHRMHR